MRSIVQRTTFLLLLCAAPLAGCAKPDHEKAIRQRAQELIGFMCADDVEGCVRLTDPLFVRAQGTEGVKLRFKLLNAIVKLGKLGPDKVRIDQVAVAQDAKSAQVTISVLADKQWKSLQPTRWVLSDGKWYLAF